jgi:hypothetical protein
MCFNSARQRLAIASLTAGLTESSIFLESKIRQYRSKAELNFL